MTENAKHPFIATPIDKLLEGIAALRQHDAYVADNSAAEYLDELTSSLRRLEGILKIDKYSPEVYLSKDDYRHLQLIGLFLENGNWRVSLSGKQTHAVLGLSAAFDIGRQEKYRFLAEQLEHFWYGQQVGAPYVDKALFRQLQRTLFWSATGEVVDRHIHKNNVPVRFRDVPADDSHTDAGNFTHDPSTLTGDITIFIRPDYTKNYLAEVLLHEGWHSRQVFHFPELFKPRSGIDRFVASKLLEHETYAVERVHNGAVAKTSRQAVIDFRNKPETSSAESVFHRKRETSPVEIASHIVAQLDRRSSEDATDFKTEVMRLDALGDHLWRHYEKGAYNDQLMFDLQAGDFHERVANHRFLQADFLTRFCVDPNGNSWLPSDPQPFFAELRDCIATLHEPMLIRAERTARNVHQVLLHPIS